MLDQRHRLPLFAALSVAALACILMAILVPALSADDSSPDASMSETDFTPYTKTGEEANLSDEIAPPPSPQTPPSPAPPQNTVPTETAPTPEVPAPSDMGQARVVVIGDDADQSPLTSQTSTAPSSPEDIKLGPRRWMARHAQRAQLDEEVTREGAIARREVARQRSERAAFRGARDHVMRAARHCYDALLPAMPDAAGMLLIEAQVRTRGGMGRLEDVRILSHLYLDSPGLHLCVLRRLEEYTFQATGEISMRVEVPVGLPTWDAAL